jgi:hypothetical protein
MKDRVNKLFESEQEQTISKFEIPYSAVAMDIKLSDGTTKVLQGLVDPALIQSYFNLMENSLHLTLDIPDRLRKVLQL